MVLPGFSDQAVKALGLYCKWQAFFFIPLGAKQSCIVPPGYAFSRAGLDWFWLTFPVTETIATLVGLVFYRGFPKQNDESKILGASSDSAKQEN